MSRMAKGAIIGLVLVFAAVLVGPVLGPAPIERDPPRDLPWVLPDYRDARTSWEIGPGGKIHTRVEHFFLEDISPAMVAWFYQHLPISTVEYRGVTYPLYHIFHPTEHGTLRVLEPAQDGTPGMSAGAMIMREEWFGPFDSRGAARIVEFSDAGMLAIPEVAGLEIGRVRHSLRAVNGGTAYSVDAVIGSDLPLIGSLINLYLRKQVFHPAMLEQWRRHQVEEVGSLQFFLAQIYAQRERGRRFVLEYPEAKTGI